MHINVKGRKEKLQKEKYISKTETSYDFRILNPIRLQISTKLSGWLRYFSMMP